MFSSIIINRYREYNIQDFRTQSNTVESSLKKMRKRKLNMLNDLSHKLLEANQACYDQHPVGVERARFVD